jgi:hypothetical protein
MDPLRKVTKTWIHIFMIIEGKIFFNTPIGLLEYCVTRDTNRVRNALIYDNRASAKAAGHEV